MNPIQFYILFSQYIINNKTMCDILCIYILYIYIYIYIYIHDIIYI